MIFDGTVDSYEFTECWDLFQRRFSMQLRVENRGYGVAVDVTPELLNDEIRKYMRENLKRQ